LIRCWRVFPWDRTAAENEPFSAGFVPPNQGYGRFDLPGEPAGVGYFAEDPEHAVAEKLVRLRNQRLDEADLLEHGRPLALVEARIELPTPAGLLDLCDAARLDAEGIQPDRTAFRDRIATQAVSRHVWGAGYAGLRWWSAFFGEWHTIVVFMARAPAAAVRFGLPEPLDLRHPAVGLAADALGITLG
jgi:hypothetical protein